jgi:hypothetical protein
MNIDGRTEQLVTDDGLSPIPSVTPPTTDPAVTDDSSLKKDTSSASSVPWNIFVQAANEQEIKLRFVQEIKKISDKYSDTLENYCVLAFLDAYNDFSINQFWLDELFRVLCNLNLEKKKDILLILLSAGGEIEPAYQISKLCNLFARERFIVCVPRFAKSAATLITLGADEIHMGILGQLGPIDPQLSSLPALGVNQALQTIASIVEEYPNSAQMFANYLPKAINLFEIGYCERISESAIQYAERLLATKPELAEKASRIARHLVQSYKDHRFVIDLEEARNYLGSDWVKTATVETQFAEEIYALFESVNRILKPTRLIVMADFDTGTWLYTPESN